MSVSRTGVFHAIPTEMGLNETGNNKLATVIVRYVITEEKDLASGEFFDVTDDRMDIIAYHYIEKKDGSINTFTVDALQAAYGWDGADLNALVETDYSEHLVQITVEENDYNGKKSYKVAFVNPYGSTGSGGVTNGDVDGIQRRLGSKLRALSSGKSVTPKPPTGKPRPTLTKPAAAKPTATMDEAFAALVTACGDDPKWTEEKLNDEFWRIVKVVCKTDDADAVTGEQWAEVAEKCPSLVVPF